MRHFYIALVLVFLVPCAVGISAQQDLAPEAQALLEEGKACELRHQYSKAQQLYEKALRRTPRSTELQSRFSRVKILCDTERRFLHPEYTSRVSGMKNTDLRFCVAEVLHLLEDHYVFRLSYEDIYYREIRALDVSLSSPMFCDKVLAHVPPSEIVKFQKELRNPISRTFASLEELVSATCALGEECENRFHSAGAFFVMEALCGLVSSLDPYSTVLLLSQYDDLMRELSGSLVGIGVEISIRNDQIFVQRTVPNSPARLAGIRDGEEILSVNGISTVGMSLDQISALLQGESGTKVELHLRSPGEMPRMVSAVRRRVALPCIEEARIIRDSDGVAYVRLLSFQHQTAKELHRVLTQLREQGMKRLVLDIRGNGGGVMLSAVETANLFLDGGAIVLTKDARRRHQYNADPDAPWRLPVAVLIDERSASAAEILAGALLERKRGNVIGARSYGKGSVQGIYRLAQADFALKITTSRFYSPSGKLYNGVGVMPNYEIHQAARPSIASTAPPFQETPISPRVGESVEKRIQENDPVLSAAIRLFSSQL
ncbi:MAG: S41 family peptidase [Planctomycetia bacterium]|nr:S41 family peptidase [Planctomycetia bacterium]